MAARPRSRKVMGALRNPFKETAIKIKSAWGDDVSCWLIQVP